MPGEAPAAQGRRGERRRPGVARRGPRGKRSRPARGARRGPVPPRCRCGPQLAGKAKLTSRSGRGRSAPPPRPRGLSRKRRPWSSQASRSRRGPPCAPSPFFGSAAAKCQPQAQWSPRPPGPLPCLAPPQVAPGPPRPACACRSSVGSGAGRRPAPLPGPGDTARALRSPTATVGTPTRSSAPGPASTHSVPKCHDLRAHPAPQPPGPRARPYLRFPGGHRRRRLFSGPERLGTLGPRPPQGAKWPPPRGPGASAWSLVPAASALAARARLLCKEKATQSFKVENEKSRGGGASPT